MKICEKCKYYCIPTLPDPNLLVKQLAPSIAFQPISLLIGTFIPAVRSGSPETSLNRDKACKLNNLNILFVGLSIGLYFVCCLSTGFIS